MKNFHMPSGEGIVRAVIEVTRAGTGEKVYQSFSGRLPQEQQDVSIPRNEPPQHHLQRGGDGPGRGGES